jgi:uncharacterized MnhB-related membrane protein
MEVKQIGMYLIIAGAVILALKFINAIISFILSDFLLGLGTLLLLAGVATTETIAGYGITENLGTVIGNTIRARHIGKDIMAGLRTIIGG